MTKRDRCVLMVGGSHSLHVTIPAQMIRDAGYRVVLADAQPEATPEAAEVFAAIYPMIDRLQ